MRKAPAKVKSGYYEIKGGEHLRAPAMKANPGWAMVARNYEIDLEGHPQRIGGYECFDGHTKPSDASYWVLYFDQGDAAMTQGDTVTGETSSATGLLYTQVLSSGSYAGGDAAGYLVLTDVSGAFQDNENLQVSAVTEAVADGTATEIAAPTTTLHTTYTRGVIAYARTRISAVPGSGNILGIGALSGTVYAWRNNSGGTAAKMYKSSTSGWTECDLGYTLAFTSGGTTEISEGDTITGATSGATGVVGRVILSSGAWGDGDAAGTFVLTSKTGTFEAENLNVGAFNNLATIAADAAATTLTAGGRYETINYNFGGHSGTYRMYGCDGKNKAFEWDGSVYVPITTGMTTDTPEHTIAHKSHLFLSFSGGSLQHSSITDPYGWSAVTGASELGFGEEIVGLKGLPGDILCIKCRNSTWLMYGSSSAGDDAWDRRRFDPEAGAIEWTNQLVENILVSTDDRGITTLRTTDEYGDFKSATISNDIDPFLKPKLSDIQCSVRCKEKGQYRLFFDDGQGIYMTISKGKVLGFTRVDLDDAPVCAYSCENASGEEEIYFGDSSGYVYQMDKGTSFDGGSVRAFLRLHYNHLGNPRQKKRLYGLQVEMDAPESFDLKVYVEYDYADALPSEAQTVSVSPTGGLWDVDDWASFVWDGQDVATGHVDLKGTGVSFSPLLFTNETHTEPHTFQGLNFLYAERGIKR